MKPTLVGVIALSALFAAVCLLPPVSAAASPLDLVAEYSSGSGGKQVHFTLENGQTIPRAGNGSLLSRIALRWHEDDASRLLLRFIRNVTFDVRAAVSAADMRKVYVRDVNIGRDALMPGALVTLATLDDLALDVDEVHGIDITMQLKFNADFLCAIESELRRRAGGPPITGELRSKRPAKETKKAKRKARKKKKEPPLGDKIATLALPTLEQPLSRDGKKVPILYSFCKEVGVDWDTVLNHRDEFVKDDRIKTAGELEKAEKAALQKRLVGELKKTFKGAAARTWRHEEEPQNVVLQMSYRFSIVRAVGHGLRLQEEREALGRIVDQDSDLYLVGRERYCQHSSDDLFRLFDSHLVVRMTSEADDGEDKTTSVDVKLEQGNCERKLKLDLKDYLEKEISLSVYYKDDGKEMLLFSSSSITVKNLGLITDFPVVSEIVASVEKWPLADDESQSTIPVAWGYDLTKGRSRQMAVMFPWVIGWNPRAAPDLSKYLSVFPHVSLVLSDNSGADEESVVAALGAGIRLGQFFTFAWGMTLEDVGRNMLFLGLSIPDISRLFL